jgi:hypothetical protein
MVRQRKVGLWISVQNGRDTTPIWLPIAEAFTQGGLGVPEDVGLLQRSEAPAHPLVHLELRAGLVLGEQGLLAAGGRQEGEHE